MINKYGKYSAIIVSGLLNPFFMPTLGLYILMNLIPGTVHFSMKLKLILYGIVFLTTCAIPVIFLLVLSLGTKLKQRPIHLSEQVLPYFFTAFSIFLGSQLLARLPVPGILRVFLLGISLVLVVLFFIRLRWKISEHTAGIGILTGTIFALIFRYGLNIQWIAIVLILLSGLLGSLRIYLEKHTLTEVFTGFFVSTIGMYLILFFI
jgi:membrane-associated phospholipid phosphatase